MFRLFKKKKTSETEFWNWFYRNKQHLEKFIDSGMNDYSSFNALTKEMKRYDEILFPEITIDDNEKYVLIITPDGIKDGVLPTQNLRDAAPTFQNWTIKAFRQPTDNVELSINGIEYSLSDIEIIPKLREDEDLVDINVFIRNMANDDQGHQHLAFLYFDHILGEFNVITRVGFIDFHHLDQNQSVKNSISLLELRKLIEDNLY